MVIRMRKSPMAVRNPSVSGETAGRREVEQNGDCMNGRGLSKHLFINSFTKPKVCTMIIAAAKISRFVSLARFPSIQANILIFEQKNIHIQRQWCA
jgi:hypothetical protein